MPLVGPAVLAPMFDANAAMRPAEVVVWLDDAVDAASLAIDGFDLVRGGIGPIAVYLAHRALGKSSLADGATMEQSVERATCDAAEVMLARPGVRCASPNYRLQPTLVPNDPFFAMQWHYPLINLPQAWSLTQGSNGVVVAVLDTGIVSAHPDFDPSRFVGGYDMISDPATARDGDGRDANPEDPGDLATPQGSSFHGTHVAGTVGARSDNGVGVAGVDWFCKLMIVRVLGQGGGSIADIADGILYAARLQNGSGILPPQRADIVNMSLGGPGLSAVLEQACNLAASAGCLLVAAAGNDNSSQPSSPAAFASVLSVGAVDMLRQRAPYSNFSNTIDIWAPGGDMSVDRNNDGFADGVLSCMADDQGGFFYAFENGTSMASPHVAGVAALVKAANPALSATQIRSILTGNTTAGVGLPNNGRVVDALAAVLAAGGAAPTTPLLVATPAIVDFGATATTSRVTVENRGTDNLVFDSSVAQPAAAWLDGTISDATPANGLDADRIDFTIDRTGLANGVYSTVVTLTYLNGATPVSVDLTVRMQVGASATSNETIFLLLVDPLTLDPKYQVDTAVGSNFAFTFAGVVPGSYLLVGGTDRDNDDELGDDGELFGAWPDLDAPQVVVVSAGVDSSGLDFGMQDLVTVQSVSAGHGNGRTFRRLR